MPSSSNLPSMLVLIYPTAQEVLPTKQKIKKKVSDVLTPNLLQKKCPPLQIYLQILVLKDSRSSSYKTRNVNDVLTQIYYR